MRQSNERGIAMITVLLVLMLMSALLVGFTTVVMSDQRYRFIDKDRGQAFYAAAGAIEKLTADLGNNFLVNVAPTAAQITALTGTTMKPAISGITYSASNAPQALPASQLTNYYCAGNKTVNGIFMPARTPTLTGTNGYTITFCALNSTGNPTTSDFPLPIKWGPYEGLIALQTPYQLDVTARTATGGEVHLSRTVEAVAIPVFQFGMFSDVDLSYYAAENFGFGGRVHTNGNLWLAEGQTQTLTMTGKITAVKDVVRQYLSNGVAIGNVGMTGTVSLATQANAPTGNRIMAATEGSVTGMPGSSAYSGWKTLSTGAAPPNYNGYIKNGSTGAKVLKLPLTAAGVGTNIDIIKRSAQGEDPAGILYGERLVNKSSLRIFLSDASTDITNMPGLSAGAPIQLDGDWRTTPPFVGYTGQPIARSMGNTGTLATTTVATTLGLGTITVGVVPTMFTRPAAATMLLAKNAGNSLQVQLTNCNTWTLTSVKCNTSAAVPAGYTVYLPASPLSYTPGVANMPGTAPTFTVSTLVAFGLSQLITAAAGTNTMGFSANSFFLNDVGAGGSGISTPVTCLGIPTATQFTGCTGVPATAIGATITTGYVTPQTTATTGTIGGWIKIERGNTDGTYTDITQEILNYGIADKDPGPSTGTTSPCADPSPNAIIRIQRLRQTNGAASCSITDTTNSYEYWPQVLFDPREGLQRDLNPNTFCAGATCAGSIATAANAGLEIQGAMYYVALDVKNLAKWFNHVAPYNAGTGNLAKIDNTGQTVYFSDRRSNRNSSSLETAEFGWEDFVNPGVADGAPNSTCDLPGEDVNTNGTCEVYGKTPTWNGAYNNIGPGPNAAPYDTLTITPATRVKRGVLQTNRPLFFRRALKLINGGTIGSDATVANRLTGLTVVSENPVYIHGDYNAASTFLVTDLHAATAVIADAVTLLSNNWNDNASFYQPYFYNTYPTAFGAAGSGGGRQRPANSYYRLAILGGKPPSFPAPSDVGVNSVFGTDGGAMNFLRMLEQDNGTQTTMNYRGSIATLAYSRQAVGTFKCCSGNGLDGVVYSVPVRNFLFDTDFLNPALLPPNTPVFRDMNAVGFSQEIRPGR